MAKARVLNANTDGSVTLDGAPVRQTLSGCGYMTVFDGTRNVYVHRLVAQQHLDLQDDEIVDHINRNPLDNRASNLRVATQPLNLGNTGMFSHNTSGTKGVYWDKRNSKWRAMIKLNGKMKCLGRYTDYDAACQARAQAAQEAWGEFTTEGAPNP